MLNTRTLLDFVPVTLLLVSLGTPKVAEANMRAPRFEPQPPSAALQATGPELEVAHEALTFTCDAACAVTAIYSVRATAPGRFSFAFVLPAGPKVRATLGTTPVSVTTGPVSAETRQAREQHGATPEAQLRHSRGAPRLAEARFAGYLEAGLTRIRVSYVQPLAVEEHDYGYFSAGRLVRWLRYELWPLGEWRLGPDFHIDVTATIRRPPPSWWQRWFGTLRGVTCVGRNGHRVTPLPGATTHQRGQSLVYRARLGPGFPAQLQCSMGDEDLL